jgi:hypothetical protein
VVIEVSATGDKHARAWLVCEKGGVSMCFDPPGFEVDVWLSGKAEALYRIWLQQTPMKVALQNGALEADGSSDCVRAVPHWFDDLATQAL